MHTYNAYCFSVPILVSRKTAREYPKRAVSITAFDPVFIDSKAHTISSKFCGARRSRC